MTYVIPPLLKAILAEATALAPDRSKRSDGTIGDRAHAARTSDHNPDKTTGIVHAVDVTHDPAGGFDSYHYAEIVRLKCEAGRETRVKYLVSHDPGARHDILASAKTSWKWRKHTTGSAHANHLHISIASGEKVEQSTAPLFVDAVLRPPVVTPEEGDVPKPTDVVKVLDLRAKGGGCWQLYANGFVRQIKGPKYGHYLDLPPDQRQGERYFVDFTERHDKPGYVEWANDGTWFAFPIEEP